jgi:hypothetical protein
MGSRFTVVLAMGLFLMGCDGGLFDQIGYFKDTNRNRVFHLQLTQRASTSEVLEAAKSVMHTEGRMTVAFISDFEPSNLVDVVTQAASFLDANDAMLSGGQGWRWWYRQSPNGEVTLVDCEREGGNSICTS